MYKCIPNKMSWKLILLFMLFVNVMGQLYEDNRCRCVCPTITSVLNNTENSARTLYIAYVPPNKCDCDGVILPKVSDEVKLNAGMFCPRCECKYETRNTTIIMVVVIFVLWIITLLIVYYIFLILLELLVSRKPNYEGMRTTSDETENLLLEDEETEDI